jgi:hypothetical protein
LRRYFANREAFCALLLVAASFALFGCAADVPPINCVDPDFDCYINQATKGIRIVRENIAYWSTINLIGQICIVVAGIVATIVIALQGDDNRHWTRPVGLVATALVTGLTSALVSFHVPDNVDKLVDVIGNMTEVVNEFDYNAEKLKAGRDPKEVEQAFRSDAKFRDGVNDLTMKYVTAYNKIKIDMLKLSGTASKLSTVQPAPPPRAAEQNTSK